MASLDHDPAIPIEAPAVREWLLGADELAFIDVREEGQFGLKMPRRATPIILVDADDGVGRRAARRLHQLGCQRLHLLPGGARAWRDAGYDLFDGTNVPSKGFAELLEIEARTSAISAEDLARLKASGEDFVLLDSRAPEEFGRFDVAGARSAPGVELIARAEDLIPSPDTLVVVTRAGRTRGIIGAQGLINSWVGVRRARLVLAATTACAPPSRRIG